MSKPKKLFWVEMKLSGAKIPYRLNTAGVTRRQAVVAGGVQRFQADHPPGRS